MGWKELLWGDHGEDRGLTLAKMVYLLTLRGMGVELFAVCRASLLAVKVVARRRSHPQVKYPRTSNMIR
jgi:hypothetical protein